MIAHLLITAEKGKEQEIYDSLYDQSEVISVNILFGEWDIIAKIDVENNEALSTFILDHVRGIPGVQMSSTLIVAK